MFTKTPLLCGVETKPNHTHSNKFQKMPISGLPYISALINPYSDTGVKQSTIDVLRIFTLFFYFQQDTPYTHVYPQPFILFFLTTL